MSTSSTKQPRLPPPPSSGGAIYNTRNSKKRAVSSLNSDFLMDPEVIEIPPPTPRSFKSKQKQVVTHEVIDVDKDEDSADILIVDVRVNARDKGKAVKSSSGHSSIIRTEDIGAKSPVLIDSDEPSNNAAPELHNMDLSYDDELYDSYIADFMDVDDYSMLQAHFDSVDIPAGVEASIPWFPDLSSNKKKAFHENISLTDGSDQSLLRWFAEPAHINKNAASVSSSKMPLTHSLGGASLSSPSLYPQAPQSTKKSSTSQNKVNSQYLPFELSLQSALVGCSTNSSSGSQSDAMTVNHPVTPASWDNFLPPVPKKFGPGSSFYSNLPVPVDALNSVVDPSMSWWPPSMNPKFNFNKNVYSSFADSVDGANITPQEVANIRNQVTVNEEDILSKLQHFKQFDTVEDVSDHHYASKSSKQPPKNWAKKIQEEWRILEKDLPDTIFVRVYESRMDLLRAVIIGAEGTPYHDGLFFFDVFFPASYPKVPPHVFYHSGGLRLNPNLYSCGKVCLSLLNTWSGSKNEKWIPGTSTMLQVLVSIQALILNQKPYFNEPGWEKQNGTARGELMSRQYNEDTFILSLKTMTYSMRRPPKHFGDFVVGHFYKRAHDILVACKAYMDGAQVGCLVKGGVQDVDEGDKSCSQNFKNSLAGCVNMLVKEFTALGAKDCEKFLTAPKCRINRADNSSKAAI